MNVLLINPRSPYLENDAAYPPMGLMYVAACFEREGANVNIMDLTTTSDNPLFLMRDVRRFSELLAKADLIGLTCVTPNVREVKRLINTLPRGIPIMVGGAHPTHMLYDTRSTLHPNIVVTGEAETIIPNIIKDYKCANDKSIFHGIYHGSNTPVELIPKPARHLVNLHEYSPGGQKTTPVYSSRGCSFNCAFCSKITGCTYRLFPIKQVIEEIHDCMDMGFEHIVFGDDNFIINVERAKQLLKEVSGLGIKFRLNQDARVIRKDVFELAAESGCTDISFGIESGSQFMLDQMHKQTTIEKNEQAIKLTKDCGMEAKAYFMVNFPGENEDTIQETIEFAKRAKPDKWLLSAFSPLPGSDVFKNPTKYHIRTINTDWSNFYLVGKGGGFKPSFTTDYLTAEKQIELHDKLYKGLKEVLG